MSCVVTSWCDCPRSTWSLRVNIAQPVETTIKPPPTCTTGSEIPKNESMCVPTTTETINRMKLFIATRRASNFLDAAEKSCVSSRNTGLPPIGFTIGNNALTISRILLAVSKNMSVGGVYRNQQSVFEDAQITWTAPQARSSQL